MRRIDAIGISLGMFVAGGLAYLTLQWVGLDSMNAGIWSQVHLVSALVVWVFSYLTRVLSKDMTYDQQLRAYEEAVLQKRLEELTPEELAAMQAEIERENQQAKG
ncbi:MAG: DUF3007 family protein [Candidatus Parcubacteria bacterium]|nr:DUF3007 family protein [Leptolyngbyaceae cyanobacterium LF-bin-113]